MDRDFKWVRIPKEIWLSEDLNMMCKVLLTEIDSLSKNEEWCYAWNEYFAKFLWISTIQVSRYISFLKENLYIEEISFNWRTRVIKSTIERGVKAALSKMIKQPNQKWQSRVIKNDKHINTYTNTSINSFSYEKDSDDVADNMTEDVDAFVKNLPTVPEKKEKSSAKKERKEYWDKDINHLIRRLKDECDGLNIAYDKTDDRIFAHHILTGKEYWEFCEKIHMSREWFAVFILNMSNQKQLYTTACAWPKSIYQNYPKVFNMAKKMYEKTTPVFLDDL